MAMRLPVLALEDLMTTKLLALREQEPDYAPVLKIARTLREQSTGTTCVSGQPSRRSRGRSSRWSRGCRIVEPRPSDQLRSRTATTPSTSRPRGRRACAGRAARSPAARRGASVHGRALVLDLDLDG